MDLDRRRRFRLITALTTALLLATAGLYVTYTAFSGATESKNPSDVLAAGVDGQTYDVTGKVVTSNGKNDDLRFSIIDPDATGKAKDLEVYYPDGTVPDPFRVGREIVITGTLDEDGVFMAEKDTLITKCPSKFKDEVDDTTNVEFVD